jgi:hypothetical protein
MSNCVSGLCPRRLSLQKSRLRETHVPFAMKHQERGFLKTGMQFVTARRCHGPFEKFRIKKIL